MQLDSTAQLIVEYRYWILIPLTFAEGPFVAFIAGTLVPLGYFNLYFLAGLFFVRDVGLDVVYYMIGLYGGRTAFAHKMLARISVTDEHLQQVKTFWEEKPFRTMFVGKLSYGIASAFIVVAGIVKMRFSTFIRYGIIVTVVQYGGLLALGYYFGNALGGSVARMVQNAQYIIALIALVVSGYYLISWRMRGAFLKESEEASRSNTGGGV